MMLVQIPVTQIVFRLAVLLDLRFQPACCFTAGKSDARRAEIVSDLPNGAESTCWEVLGGYSFPKFSPSGRCMFSDRKTRNPEDFHKEIAAGS